MRFFYLPLIALLLLASCNQQKPLTKTPERTGNGNNTIAVQPINSIGVPVIAIQPQKHTFNNRSYYEEAYTKLELMLDGQEPASFKDAVFTTENAWYNNTLSYEAYNNYIKALTIVCKAWERANPLKDYKADDSLQIELSGAVYKAMTDTLKDVKGKIITVPYSYNFSDAFADKYWADRFVLNLMATHTGNCHSLPFLYKIVAEELHTPAYLSLLPEHIYIRQPSKQVHWYNTELTSRTFPVDAWLMTSGYVSTDNIVSGLYMDTLGLQQSIAVCINDLAKGYQREFQNTQGNNTTEDLQFMVQCCNLGLKYYPNYGEMLLLKAETLKKLYQKGKGDYNKMEQTYSELVKLDYREIPDAMYYRWMGSLVKGDTIWNRKADSLIKPYNPFASIGKIPKGYLTLSNGYYDENFINDTLRQVGSVVFNIVTDKVDHFIQKDETAYIAQLQRPKDDSRFMSLDPMAVKYPYLSPYSAFANNPIMFVDPNGDTLQIAESTTGDIEAYKTMVSVAFAGKVQAEVDENGIVTFCQNPNTQLTNYEQASLNYLNDAVNDKIKATFHVRQNDPNVALDNFYTNTLDVADVQAMGNNDQLLTSKSILIHFTSEQIDKAKDEAVNKKPVTPEYEEETKTPYYHYAHVNAMAKENKTSDIKRDPAEEDKPTGLRDWSGQWWSLHTTRENSDGKQGGTYRVDYKNGNSPTQNFTPDPPRKPQL